MYSSAASSTISAIVTITATLLGFIIIAFAFYLQSTEKFYRSMDWMKRKEELRNRRYIIMAIDQIFFFFAIGLATILSSIIILNGIQLFQILPLPSEEINDQLSKRISDLLGLFTFFLFLLPNYLIIGYIFGIDRSNRGSEKIEKYRIFHERMEISEQRQQLAIYETFRQMEKELGRSLTDSEIKKEWNDFAIGDDCRIRKRINQIRQEDTEYLKQFGIKPIYKNEQRMKKPKNKPLMKKIFFKK